MIIDGKKLAGEILDGLKKEIAKSPRLTVGAILVGKNPVSRPDIESGRGSPALRAAESFLKQKAKVADTLGVNFKIFRYNSKIKTEKLRKEILKINKNQIKSNYPSSRRSSVNGIIVQLPLPKHINIEKILAAINPKKDIDALSAKPLVLAPTVEAVKFIFQKYLPTGDPNGDKINYKDKNILIVGRGRLVGQPIFNWLNANKSYRQSLRSNVKIKIINVKQKNKLPKLARWADIIISGVGKAGLVTGNMIKKGAILIDFGFDRQNGKIRGDFDFDSCVKKAKLITPVPGGMGPIMVAMLFKNLFKLNKL